MKLRDITIALFVLTAPVAKSEILPVFVPLSQTDLDDPQGEHLTKRCRNWQRKRVLDIGLCPEVA